MPKYDFRRNRYELKKLKQYLSRLGVQNTGSSYTQMSNILNFYEKPQEIFPCSCYIGSSHICFQPPLTNWKLIMFLILISTVSTRTNAKSMINTCTKGACISNANLTLVQQLEKTNICLFSRHLKRCNMPSDVSFVVNKGGILQAESCFRLNEQQSATKNAKIMAKCQEDSKKVNQVLTSEDSECKKFSLIKNQIDEENSKYIDSLKHELFNLGTMGTEPVNMALNNLGFKHKILLNLEKMILKYRLGNCGELAFLTEARLLINNIKSGNDIRIHNVNLLSRGIQTTTGYDQHTFCVIGAPQNISDKIVSGNVTSVQEYLDKLNSSTALICDSWINQGVLIPFSQAKKEPYGALYGFGPRRNFYNNLQAVSLRNFTPTEGLSSSQAKHVRIKDRSLNNKLKEAVQSFERLKVPMITSSSPSFTQG